MPSEPSAQMAPVGARAHAFARSSAQASGTLQRTAPTFAAMALLTALFGGHAPVALCMAQHASPLSGMVPMYLLMSVFHLVPWLNLASGRRTSAS